MELQISFKLNDRPVNFSLSEGLMFILNSDVVNFKLNAVILADGSFRLLEDDFIRLMEDGTYRLLDNG